MRNDEVNGCQSSFTIHHSSFIIPGAEGSIALRRVAAHGRLPRSRDADDRCAVAFQQTRDLEAENAE
jgi:hypothetical protein